MTDPNLLRRRLRLYVASSTPNSARAEDNLRVALDGMGGERPELEIVDVFTQPRRAVTDGVIVTPTLIGLRGTLRLTLIGDLTDAAKLHGLLRELVTSA